MRTRLLALLAILAPTVPADGADDDPPVPIPPRVVTQCVPPIPSSLMAEVKPYRGYDRTRFQGWYGRGREILARANQVYHLQGPDDGELRRLTNFKGEVFGVYPRLGCEQFLVAVDPDGREENQFYLVEPREKRTTRLTAARAESFYPEWSPSGRFLAYSDAPFAVGESSVRFLEPPASKPLRSYTDLGGGARVHAWSPDERRVAVIHFDPGRGRNNVLLVDVATGKAESIGTSRAFAMNLDSWRKIPLRWSHDGRSLYWTTVHESDFVRLVRYDLETKQETGMGETIRWDVEEFDLADDNQTLAVLANEDGASVLHLIDAETGKECPAPRMPVGVASDLAFRPGSTELAFSLQTPGFPMRVHSFNLRRGQAERWKLGVDTPNPGATSEPEVVRYPAGDGELIPALVTWPPASFPAPHPVLVLLHGGPQAQSRPVHLGYFAYLVNQLGIAVIRPNYRGSTGYGYRFECLDDGDKREGAIRDIGALLDWIGSRPGFDKGRVAVSGGSYGGFLALSALVRYGDRLVAGVDDCGISDFSAHLAGKVERKQAWSSAEYGDVSDPAKAEFLRSISPLAAASKIRTPLLVVHGQNDPRVLVAEAARIVAAVRANGVPVWCILGRDEGHIFNGVANCDYRALAEVAFLKRYLRPTAGDPAPGR